MRISTLALVVLAACAEARSSQDSDPAPEAKPEAASLPWAGGLRPPLR
jgi:hypothetical protein